MDAAATAPVPVRRGFRVLSNAAHDRNLVAWMEDTDAEDGGFDTVIAWAGGAPLYPIHSAVRLSSTNRIVVADYLKDYSW